MQHTIPMIVLTGGPGGGKSTVLQSITPWLTEQGFTPYVVPETATELITTRGAPNRSDKEAQKAFQKEVLERQLEKEQEALSLAKRESRARPLVLCDRGTVDGFAYAPQELASILNEQGTLPAHLLNRYSAVLHLESAARGTPHHYTQANNSARFENAEQATLRDELTLRAWLGHSHLTLIPSRETKKEKEVHVQSALAKALGIPRRIEIERRFLLEEHSMPFDLPVYHTSAHIEQRYVIGSSTDVTRIRARSYGGVSTYEHTTKRFLDTHRVEEDERALDFPEYRTLVNNMLPGSRALHKERIYFVWHHHVFELDIFKEELGGLRILEVELCGVDEPYELPPFLPIVKEVTGEKRYSNAALARAL